VALNNLGDSDSNTGQAFLAAGDFKRAMDYLVRAPEAGARASAREGNVGFLLNSVTFMGALGAIQAQLGDSAGLAQTLDRVRAAGVRLARVVPAGTARALLTEEGGRTLESLNFLLQGNAQQAQRASREAVTRLQRATVEGDADRQIRQSLTGAADDVRAMAGLELADYADAEVAARAALEQRRASDPPGIIGTARDLNEATAWLAAALARQGRSEEAGRLLAPALKFQRGLLARNKSDVWLHFELARVLYAQACAEPAQRAALLKEASAQIAASPPQVAATPIVTWLKRMIARG
jgi:tetratricopeptide (TPR) repeat protein